MLSSFASLTSLDLVGDGTSSVPVAAPAVENSAECALDTVLLPPQTDAPPPIGASADLHEEEGWEKANTEGHDELATAAAARATTIMDLFFDDIIMVVTSKWLWSATVHFAV